MTKPLTYDDVFELNKHTLFEMLAAEGVTEIVLAFDGGGDEGSFHGADVYPEDKGEVLRHEITLLADGGRGWNVQRDQPLAKPAEDRRFDKLIEALEQMGYDVIDRLYAGWENNDGAWGEVAFQVQERKIVLDMNQRYTDSNFYQHEY